MKWRKKPPTVADSVPDVWPSLRYASGGFVQPRRSMAEIQSSLNRTLASLSAVSGSFGPGPNAFSGSEFAMGTAVGVRSWDVDKYGRLVSPTYKTVWTPNELVAECRVDRDSVGRLYVAWGTDPIPTEPEQPEHKQSSCSCGFYAYYEGYNEYARDDRITGVIEGYGETQIGTRGFKSAKARVVALHVPTNESDGRQIGQTRFDRVRTNYGARIPIFDNYAEMAAEFPTTQPEDYPTPETDADFWTREA